MQIIKATENFLHINLRFVCRKGRLSCRKKIRHREERGSGGQKEASSLVNLPLSFYLVAIRFLYALANHRESVIR